MAKKFDRADHIGFSRNVLDGDIVWAKNNQAPDNTATPRDYLAHRFAIALQAALAVVDLEKRIKEIRLDESVPPHVFDDLCRQASDAIKRCEELGLTKEEEDNG